MNPLQSTRVALRALRVNKLRSILTMLGIIIGVGAVIAMVGVGSGAQARVAEQIQSLGSNLIIVLSGSTNTSGIRLGQGSRLSITEEDSQAIAREIPAVQATPPSTAKKKVLGVSQANARSVGAISVKVRPGEDMAEAEGQMRDLLRQRHRLQPYQEDDFTLRNLSEILQTQEESSKVMTYLLAAIASVSLLVGGIGIMNIMLVSVTERTREIGLRMAVGARGRDILMQFLVEAVTLSLIGGIIGIVLGLVGSEAISQFAEWRTQVPAGSVAMAFGFSAAVGVFFGFYPARKAARLDPIEALRYE